MCANEMAGGRGLLDGFRMGTGDQKDQGMVRGWSLSGLLPKPPGSGMGLEVEFNH